MKIWGILLLSTVVLGTVAGCSKSDLPQRPSSRATFAVP